MVDILKQKLHLYFLILLDAPIISDYKFFCLHKTRHKRKLFVIFDSKNTLTSKDMNWSSMAGITSKLFIYLSFALNTLQLK